ncbi:hypothetical protein M406DRAFT_247642, partial [Cryphonectria parasitica EP155]
GSIITFSRSSNEDLDKILKELTHKIILPSYLSVPQRKKLFRSRWKHKLEQDPIEIELDDQRIRLRHIDSAGGAVPAARRMLYQAMDNMRTTNDWQKLPGLLEALWFNANRRFLPSDWPKIVRKAGQAGHMGPVFEAMKNPGRTGLKLDSSETVQEVMTAVVWQAASEGWTAGATERAYRNAERVIQFLAEEGHQLQGQAKTTFEKTDRFPLRKDPQVLATPLLLAAAMVVKHGKDGEHMKRLRVYAQIVLEQWPENKGLLELHPHEAYVDPEGMAYLMERNRFLTVAAPILRGFDLAVEALGADEMGQELKSRRNAVSAEVHDALAAVEKGKRGATMYEKCFAEPQVQKTKKAAAAAAETAA